MKTVDPESVKKLFYLSQIVLGVGFLGVLYRMFFKKMNESQFRSESDSTPKSETTHTHFNKPQIKDGRSATASTPKPKPPLRLTGISLGQEPHKILGIPLDSSLAQIQTAYRTLMKQYHPDKIGPADSPQWLEAQKIAHALTEAKNSMIQKIKNNKK